MDVLFTDQAIESSEMKAAWPCAPSHGGIELTMARPVPGTDMVWVAWSTLTPSYPAFETCPREGGGRVSSEINERLAGALIQRATCPARVLQCAFTNTTLE